MQKVTPCLWFDGQAEGAGTILRLAAAGFADRPRDPLAGRHAERTGRHGARPSSSRWPAPEFIGLNGGPQYRFTEAVSFQIACADQAEVDRLWSALSDGGSEGPCGWLKDRWGLSWQIVPSRLHQLLADPDPDRSRRAMEAMLQMSKLNIAELERAADGR